MRLAHITPTAHLNDLLLDCDYHLVLATVVLNDKRYCDWYRQAMARGDYVILDNDAHELKDQPHQLTLDTLQRAIDALGPDEVVLPDKVGAGAQETIDMAFDAVEKLQHQGLFMAVPQAKTIEQYYECAKTLYKNDYVQCLGVSYLPVEKQLGQTRPSVVHVLHELLPDAELHMLGEAASLRTLLDKSIHNKVRGLDTAKLVNWGINVEMVTKDRVPPHKGRSGGPFEYFDIKMDWQQLWYAHKNIQYWSHYVNAVE